MFNNFALLDLSTADLLIILAIVVLLFGSKKLPELSRSLGKSAKELRNSLQDISQSHTELKSSVQNTLRNDDQSPKA